MLCKKKNHIWVAICIDLNLVAQGDSIDEAAKNLHSMVHKYVLESCTVDKQYFSDLMPRRSPLSFYLTYYYIVIRDKFKKDDNFKRFNDVLPMIPVNA